MPVAFIHCVKGNDNGTASLLWRMIFRAQDATSPQTVVCGTRGEHGNSIVQYLANAQPSSIYNDLKIKNGEIKILVECTMLYFENINYPFGDGRLSTTVSVGEAMGFWMLQPKASAGVSAAGGFSFFSSVVIFTPKPGLFSETPPS
jgi:hypothetical protein